MIPGETAAAAPPEPGLSARIRSAVLWRSGSQIVAQLIAWTSTFLVIRLLAPSDYGVFAMAQVVLILLNLMNGYGFASAIIRQPHVSREDLARLFGVLILFNAALAIVQFAAAPLAAAWFREPLLVDLLRVQALLYLATPFIALPHAILSRAMDFRRPAQVRLAASLLAALTAIACALAGWGIWTLVAAPMVFFYAEAIGMTWAARSLMWPSFRLTGGGALIGFGGAMTAAQFFWFVQSQSDVFIAGRNVDAHQLGLYTTALFLAQLIATKFVPPLNEVAFAAYARMQDDRAELAAGFLKTARLILLIATPAYLGLAATADPLVRTFLGEKWEGVAGLLPILGLAMPFVTLQILFAPATNALGRPRIALATAMIGSAVLPVAFLIGIHWGVTGLAWGWLGGMILLTCATAALSLPVIGVAPRALGRALWPITAAALAMALLVEAVEPWLAALGPAARLAALASLGFVAYTGLLFVLARPLVVEAAGLLRRQPLAA